MTRADNTDATLDFIVAYVRMLRDEIPVAKASIRLLNDVAKARSAECTDGGGHGSGRTSPVEGAVLCRIPGNHSLQSLDDELDAAAKTLRHLLNDCRSICKMGRKIPPRDGEPARCDGGAGREGYLLPRNEGGWSYPDCENIVKGCRTCDRCRQASSRWNRELGAA